MSEDFNAQGRISLNVEGVEDIDALVTSLGRFNEETGGTNERTERLERDLAKVGRTAREAASSMATGATDTQRYAAEFDRLSKQADLATEAIRAVAQASIGAGGSGNASAIAAQAMTLTQAKQILDIRAAEGVTAEQVARRVVKAEEQKQKAANDTATLLASSRLSSEQAARDRELAAFRGDIESRENRLRAYGDFRAQQTTEHLNREKSARAQELASFRATIKERMRLEQQAAQRAQAANADSAKRYQNGLTSASSFLGQANNRAASTGLRASDTSWAQEAKAIQSLNLEYDAHVQSFNRVMAEKSAASQQTALYNQYLWEQERAQSKAAQATDTAAVALPRLRYALYDVATTAGIMNTTIAASGGAILAASSSYERSFTDVERTTLAGAEATDRLKSELMQLTREIPKNWGFVTEVGAIGAQLNIAEQDLASFTETTTKFSTVTGVSAEQSAMAFGSLGQLLGVTADQYENMGSAIAYVGVNSVATDEEIVKMSQRLAASAENAGMTAQEVIALSGALASLRIAPERAQGVMEVYFKSLNNAIAEGGDRLEAFAAYSGLTTEQVRDMVATNPAGFFRELAAGLSELDSVSNTRALDDLGLSGIRAGEVFTRVSGNLEVFDKALVDSNSAWEAGTHLADAYGLVVDDLASKWQIFLNGVMEAAAGLGDALAPAAKFALDTITPLVQQFAAFVQTPAGKWAVGIAAALGGIVFVLTGIVGSGALAMASIAALGTATAELTAAGAGSIFTLRGMSGAMTQVATAAGFSTRAINVFKIGLASTGIGLAVLLLGSLAAAFAQSGDTAEAAFNKYVGSTAGLAEAVAADTAAYNEQLAEMGAASGTAIEGFTVLQTESANTAASVNEHSDALRNVASILGTELPGSAAVATGALDTQTVALGDNALAWLKNSLMQSDAFANLADDSELVAMFEQNMVTFDQLVQVASAEGQAGIDNLWRNVANQNNASASIFYSGVQAWFINAISSIKEYIRYMGELWFTAEGWADPGKVGKKHSKNQDEIWSNKTPYRKSIQDLNDTLLGATQQAQLLDSASLGLNNTFDEGVGSAGNYGDSLGDAGDAAEKATEKVVTLKDYASDLSSVWERAFDIRYGNQASEDAITSAWRKMADEADSARQAITKQRQEIRGLKADMDETRASMASLRSQQQDLSYWLMVAENYGDSLRASEIRAEMAENSAKLSSEEAKLADQGAKVKDAQARIREEQEKLNRTTKGSSDAAIENRQRLTELISKYQDHLRTLAENGASQEVLRAKTEELRKKFIEQATQMGYSRAEVNRFARSFDDMTTSINNVPRNVTVRANANPALQALAEFEARSLEKMTNVQIGANNTRAAIEAMGGTSDRVNAKAGRGAALQARISENTRYMEEARKRGDFAAANAIRETIRSDAARLSSGNYRQGGYTGNGGVNEIAGAVHGQEFVFSAPAVQNIGLRNLTAMHDAAKAGRSTARASSVAPRVQEVELSPADRQLLIDVKNAVGISLDGNAMQRFAGAGAINSGRTGKG